MHQERTTEHMRSMPSQRNANSRSDLYMSTLRVVDVIQSGWQRGLRERAWSEDDASIIRSAMVERCQAPPDVSVLGISNDAYLANINSRDTRLQIDLRRAGTRSCSQRRRRGTRLCPYWSPKALELKRLSGAETKSPSKT